MREVPTEPQGGAGSAEIRPVPEGLREAADQFEARFLDDEDAEMGAFPHETRRDEKLGTGNRAEPAQVNRRPNTKEGSPLSRADGGDQQVARPDGTNQPVKGESGSSVIGENGHA